MGCRWVGGGEGGSVNSCNLESTASAVPGLWCPDTFKYESSCHSCPCTAGMVGQYAHARGPTSLPPTGHAPLTSNTLALLAGVGGPVLAGPLPAGAGRTAVPTHSTMPCCITSCCNQVRR